MANKKRKNKQPPGKQQQQNGCSKDDNNNIDSDTDSSQPDVEPQPIEAELPNAGSRRASKSAAGKAPEKAPEKVKKLSLLDRIYYYCLYNLFLPFFLGLLLALYCRHCLWPAGVQWAGFGGGPQRHHNRPLVRPEPLMSYVQFSSRYPRKHYRLPSYLERAHRSLLFNLDLISCGQHNLAYLARRESYSMHQSPFKSDRTLEEQADFLGQLDEFNLTQIMSNSENRRRLRLSRQRRRSRKHGDSDNSDDDDDDDGDGDTDLDDDPDGLSLEADERPIRLTL